MKSELLENPEIVAEFATYNKHELSFQHEAQFLLSHLQKAKATERVQVEDCRKVLIDAALTGLTLNPSLNYAYVDVQEMEGKMIPTYQVGYQGMISNLKELSDVQDVIAHVVFDKETFEGCQGLNPSLSHVPYYFLNKKRKDRGSPIGVYAVIVFESGYRKFDFLSAERIAEIRNHSFDYRMDQKNGTQHSSWNNEHWEEMWMKTVIKHAYKTIPKASHGADLQTTQLLGTTFNLDNKNYDGFTTSITPIDTFAHHPPSKKTEDFIDEAIEKGKTDFNQQAAKVITSGDSSTIKVTTVEDFPEEPNGAVPSRKELEEMYNKRDAKRRLDRCAKELGILDDILKNHTGKRLSKKIVYNGILKHYDANGIHVPKDAPQKPAKKTAEKFVEDEQQIFQTAERIKEEINLPGLTHFAKASLQLLDYMQCPSKDSEKLRSSAACTALYSFIQNYGVEQELEAHLQADPYDYLAKASNDELTAALRSL